MHKTVILFLLLSLVLNPRYSYAQTMAFDHITINDGLSSNTIYTIIEDKDGFFWFGSRDGLHRYDGYEFKIFKSSPEDSLSMPSNNVQALFLHPNGDIWIGLKVGGICVFERQTQKLVINPFQGLSFPNWNEVSVQAIFQDSFGDYWIGMGGQGVLHIDKDLTNSIVYTLLETGYPNNIGSYFCFSFTEDEWGNVWMGTEGTQIPYYERESGQIRFLPQNETESLGYSFTKSLLIVDDQLWIGTQGNGLHLYDLPNMDFAGKKLENKLIKDIAQDSSGQILISTDGEGLFITTDKGNSFQQIQFSAALLNSLNTNALYDVFVDSNSNVWIGSFNGGVNVYKANKANFLTYRQSSLLNDAPGSQSVLAFCEDQKGFIWIGKDGGGLLKLDPETRNEAVYLQNPQNPGSISSNVVASLYEDSRGIIWAGTFANGLNRFDPNTDTFKSYRNETGNPNSLTNNNVWAIEEDLHGNLWIGTLGGGLNKFVPEEEKFYRYQLETINSAVDLGTNIQALLLDRTGDLWIGTEYNGLFKLIVEQEQLLSWYKEERDSNSLQSNSILCLHQDQKGRIWAGTEGGGLHMLLTEEEGFLNYSEKNGLPSNVVHAIEEDKNGILWLSTNMGLSAFNPDAETFTNYDQNDGLQSRQFNRNASLNTSSGALYFGGINGVNVFHPEAVGENRNVPRIVFTDFTLFNESVPVGEFGGRVILSMPLNEEPVIKLKHSDNVFSIAFAAIEFANPSKNEYEYQLEGFDEEWIKANAKNRRITYTNLDAGEYTFKVKAANNSGIWNEEAKRLRIIITPPFWETWWFRLFIAMLFLGLVVVYIQLSNARRKREHQQQMMEAEQEILKLKNEKLGRMVDEKNAQLSAALLQTAHKNNSLGILKKELAELEQDQSNDPERKRELRMLVRKIDTEINSESYWEQFQLNFDQVHQQFATKIHQKHPQLTANDLRLCCLIKINMTNKEIASIRNISVSAVEKSKYRLKRKLNLKREEDLNIYVLDFS